MVDAGKGRGAMPPGDGNLLLAVRDFFETVDPMPLDLPERIRFALALHDLEAEVARVARTVNETAQVTRGAEESRIVTFDSDRLTIMIRIESNPDGTARVDGWLAPAQAHRVEIRMADKSMSAIADELGRFVFYNVPRGTGRLIVRPLCASPAGERGDDPLSAASSVITPALSLLAESGQQTSDHCRTASGGRPAQRATRGQRRSPGRRGPPDPKQSRGAGLVRPGRPGR
jgi:hypothetical protein